MTITDERSPAPADPAGAVTDDMIDAVMARADAGGLGLLGPDGVLAELTKRILERGLAEELSDHLGYERGDPAGRGSGNSRNGTSAKTILTEEGEIDIAVPRDRAGSFEPLLIAKGQTRFDGFDDKILSLYARGMTVREIQGHLSELYGAEVSPDLISG